MSDLVQLTKSADIAVITINNPPVNALSPGVPEGIAQAISEIESDNTVRAAVLIGGGRSFVAGADIKEFGKIVSGQRPRGEGLHPLLSRIENCRKPVVMAIHGSAFGGGLELAMAGHYRVAAPDAQVGQPEVKLGIIPGAGGTQRLSRLVGPSKAKDLIFTGRFVAAEEAQRIGLVDEVVPDEEVYDAARAWAAKFAEGPAYALRAAKEAIDAGLSVDLETGLQIERQQFAALFATEDRTEGMQSFIDNGPGKARFSGR